MHAHTHMHTHTCKCHLEKEKVIYFIKILLKSYNNKVLGYKAVLALRKILLWDQINKTCLNHFSGTTRKKVNNTQNYTLKQCYLFPQVSTQDLAIKIAGGWWKGCIFLSALTKIKEYSIETKEQNEK